MEEERIMPEEIEESVESKISGKRAMIAQYERMIAENHRMINLGDDVEGRTKMIKHLTKCIAEDNAEIAKLEQQ